MILMTQYGAFTFVKNNLIAFAIKQNWKASKFRLLRDKETMINEINFVKILLIVKLLMLPLLLPQKLPFNQNGRTIRNDS